MQKNHMQICFSTHLKLDLSRAFVLSAPKKNL